MSPTIRIDDEVYRWLQNQAVPFDDSPNSVLRRVAGLDTATTNKATGGESAWGVQTDSGGRSMRRQPLARANDLIRKMKLQVSQARFHRDGTFFETISRFPAALIDAHGYIIFQSEEELRSNGRVSTGAKLNVRGGISSMVGYIKAAIPV